LSEFSPKPMDYIILIILIRIYNRRFANFIDIWNSAILGGYLCYDHSISTLEFIELQFISLKICSALLLIIKKIGHINRRTYRERLSKNQCSTKMWSR
jgi:hypothetical protein